jgi:hypothetical protein
MIVIPIQILSVPEMASLLETTKANVLSGIHSGKIPAYKLSQKAWMVLKTDALKVLAERQARKPVRGWPRGRPRKNLAPTPGSVQLDLPGEAMKP